MLAKPKLQSVILSFLLTGIFLFSSCGSATVSSPPPAPAYESTAQISEAPGISEPPVQISEPQNASTPDIPKQSTDGILKISYLDVGQGDCAFIILPNGESILIDAGNQSDGQSIIEYIRNSGITTLDYVIVTHPHTDHIGGMAQVINSFEVKNVYMPKKAHTTRTFENLLDTIERKGLSIQSAKGGLTLFDYGNLKAEFLAPNAESYANLNNYSAVLLLTYGDRRFLFMGDAEAESEMEIIASGYDITADVLKVGHHGSKYSSTEPFISAVNPSYAIVSVGAYNSYGHPAPSVLTMLNQYQADIWRTDEKGTVIVTCDGVQIALEQIATTVQPNAPPDSSSSSVIETSPSSENLIVYVTRTGTKYHMDGCRYLKSGKIACSLSDLDRNRYTPCLVCNPPEKGK